MTAGARQKGGEDKTTWHQVGSDRNSDSGGKEGSSRARKGGWSVSMDEGPGAC